MLIQGNPASSSSSNCGKGAVQKDNTSFRHFDERVQKSAYRSIKVKRELKSCPHPIFIIDKSAFPYYHKIKYGFKNQITRSFI